VNKIIATFWILAFLTSLGCTHSPYELAPVHGTVTIDGQPMTHGKVMFAPMAKQGELNPGKPAFGIIDGAGHFTLSTYGDEDGAVVGAHTATVINIPTGTSSAASPMPVTQNVPKFRRVLVPGKFTVVAGKDNEIEVELTTSQIAQFGS
jgi:hypothetical protein